LNFGDFNPKPLKKAIPMYRDFRVEYYPGNILMTASADRERTRKRKTSEIRGALSAIIFAGILRDENASKMNVTVLEMMESPGQFEIPMDSRGSP
jgi:hypothetical protein